MSKEARLCKSRSSCRTKSLTAFGRAVAMSRGMCWKASPSKDTGLTGWQVRLLLGLRNRMDLDSFLKKAGVYREYTFDELERDFQNSRRASDEVASRP